MLIKDLHVRFVSKSTIKKENCRVDIGYVQIVMLNGSKQRKRKRALFVERYINEQRLIISTVTKTCLFYLG